MDDYYSETGQFLYRDDKETDNIIIQKQNIAKQILQKAFGNLSLVKDMPDVINTPIEETTLSSEAYSNIFTDVLSKMYEVDDGKLYHEKVSVFVSINGETVNNKFNNPYVGYADAYTGQVDGQIRVTACIFATNDRYQADNRYLFSSISNIENILGVHEFVGHGLNKWTDDNNTHYKNYDLQMNHSSWGKTTDAYKQAIRNAALRYEDQRRKK
jgi:hypothetical protein